MLFLALLLTWNTERAQLKEWAAEVTKSESARLQELGPAWERPAGDDWEPNEKRIGRLLQPMHLAVKSEARTDFLEQACKAMQALRLPGQTDGLHPCNLKYYLQMMPGEKSVTSKKRGAVGWARWKGAALVKVAELVKKHSPQL